jgi:argininosuccinate synthase
MAKSNKTKKKKVVLAYSGGLDTTVMVHWFKNTQNLDVICFAADLGQGEFLAPLRARAKKTGAKKLIIRDLQDEFIRDYCFPSLQSGALYEGRYPMATALGRPLITKHLLEIAKAEGADFVAHGCTGKGNDQARFEFTRAALAPDIEVLVPIRHWEMKTRESEIDYVEEHGLECPVTKKKPYSIDRNLWGMSIECGVLEDPWVEPPDDAWQMTVHPDKAPAHGAEIEIKFERGLPVAIDGKRMKPVALVDHLRVLGAKHGVGRIDMLEDRMVGFKSRELYETPAAAILHRAHAEAEAITLDRTTIQLKAMLAPLYAQLIYDGHWFHPAREAIDALVQETQRFVNATIRLRLRRSQVLVTGRKSPNSAYSFKLATYDEKDVFDQRASEGHLKLLGLPAETLARVRRGRWPS